MMVGTKYIAGRMGVTSSTIRSWIASGKLDIVPSVDKLGHRSFHLDEFEEWIKRTEEKRKPKKDLVDTLSILDVSKILNVSRWRARQIIDNSGIAVFGMKGKAARYMKDEVLQFLKNRKEFEKSKENGRKGGLISQENQKAERKRLEKARREKMEKWKK